ncbi:MAG: dicarboxylate/amino acid:cation symporter [Kofleriaceae bacterium]
MRLSRPPLYVQVIVGVVLGAIAGTVMGIDARVLGVSTADLGQLGMLVIRILKMLAVPLVLLAIMDSIVRSDEITGRKGLRLIVICLVNVSVAFTIGLTLMNLVEPGTAFVGHLQELAVGLPAGRQAPEGATLSLLPNLNNWIPESIAQPFNENNVIAVVLIAILAGAAIRKARRDPDLAPAMSTVALAIEGSYRVVMQMLTWVIKVVPFAVFCVVAQVVGRAGIGVFHAMWGFLAIILVGFAIHGLIYYPLVAWLVGGKSPRIYLGRGADAVLTGLSTNSSLATVPITLRCLDRMGVSQGSARLAACVGTNLNNDGITLYEAMAALFLAQALGYDLSLGTQITIVVASLMAGMGVAGVPEAGYVVLPLVLAAAGMSEAVVTAVLPLVFAVDWVLARCRSGVNVLSDMVVAVLLDGRGRTQASPPPPSQ